MKKLSAILILVYLAMPIAWSQNIFLTHNGSASFISDAPLEVIKAESGKVSGIMNPDDRSFAFSIDNKSFKGFNSNLQQEHFYENYMETDEYPYSTFKGKIIEEIDLSTSNEQVVRAKGKLEIHGISQDRIIKGTVKVNGDMIMVKADFNVLIEDHQIKIPRVVYQKIASEIRVSVAAELIRKTD